MFKRLMVGMVTLIVVLVGYGIFFATDPTPAPRSPALIGENTDPGTGHAFGFNIEYTIVRHEMHDGVPMAVIHSGAPNEEHVEIWSPIPQLVELKDGSSFLLHEKETWDEAFELVKLEV